MVNITQKQEDFRLAAPEPSEAERGVSKIVKNTARQLPPAAGKGRPKGSKNKVTSLLKDAVIEAAVQAGNKDGLVGYLKQQAIDHPTAFLTLLGKVLPIQHAGEVGAEIKPITVIKRVFVSPKPRENSTA